MAKRAPILPLPLALSLCLAALFSPALAKIDLSRPGLRTLPKALQMGAALPASAEFIHSEFTKVDRRSLVDLDKSCDVTNVKIMTRFLANLTPPGEDIRNLFELRFTSTCAFNLTNAIFSYCWNFATYSPNGLPNPLSASSCTPTAPGFRDVDVKVNGQLWSDVFCRLQLNQGTCRGSNPPVQLLPGQSVSLFYVDLTRYMLCAYDVTFDTGAKDTRSLDTNLANPRSCAPDTPPATCLPSSLKNVYCKPGNFKLYSPSCSKAKWC